MFAVGLCSERTLGKQGILSVGHPKGWRNSVYSLVKLLHLYGFSDKVFHVRTPKLCYRHYEWFFFFFLDFLRRAKCGYQYESFGAMLVPDTKS